MKLVDILEEGRVIHRLSSTTRDEVLRELVHRGFVQRECNTELGIADEDQVFNLLLDRERTTSTGIKDGLAIPHGKLVRLDTVLAAVGLSETGVDFGAPDGKKSRVFVALLAPEGNPVLHLKALARISRVFADPGLVDALMEPTSPQAVFQRLAAEDAKF